MSLSVNDLVKIQESERLTSDDKEVIKIIISAINDWPRQIDKVTDYEREVYSLLGKEINKNNLEHYISKINYSENAWEGESLSQLIEIFDYYEKGKTLKELLKELQNEIE